MKKIIFAIIGIGILIGACTLYYVFVYSKNNQRDPLKEKAIVVQAEKIVQEFQQNENQANLLYLDKTVEIKGVVAAITKNQENKTVISLKSADPFAAVACTLKIEDNKVYIGKEVTLKGICKGFLSDVVIVECVIL